MTILNLSNICLISLFINLNAILLIINFEVIFIIISDSSKLFSLSVLPVETRSIIVEQIPNFGASSTEPFNLMHSALIPFFAKKLVTILQMKRI